MKKVSAYSKDALDFLVQTSDSLNQQIEFLDGLISSNQKAIKGAISTGLQSDKDGAYIALKLLKLQSDKTYQLHSQVRAEGVIASQMSQAEMVLSVCAQVFAEIKRWMDLNSIHSISNTSLPDLEDYIMMKIIVLNGHSGIVDETEELPSQG